MPEIFLDSLLASMGAQDHPVTDVLVGVHWTSVCSKHCGLASTLTGEGPHGHDQLESVGSLHKKTAKELSQWLGSENQLAASIGLAAINSLMDVDESQAVEINAAEVLLRKGKNANVAVVGHFPFVEKLKHVANHCWVIEKKPYGEDLPEQSANLFLPQADVIAITATSLINHTFNSLHSLIQPGAFVMVLGPSTPLTPLWFDFGISVYSGTRVIDPETANLTIRQGAVFSQVKGVRLLSFARNKADLL